MAPITPKNGEYIGFSSAIVYLLRFYEQIRLSKQEDVCTVLTLETISAQVQNVIVKPVIKLIRLSLIGQQMKVLVNKTNHIYSYTFTWYILRLRHRVLTIEKKILLTLIIKCNTIKNIIRKFQLVYLYDNFNGN